MQSFEDGIVQQCLLKCPQWGGPEVDESKGALVSTKGARILRCVPARGQEPPPYHKWRQTEQSSETWGGRGGGAVSQYTHLKPGAAQFTG